MNRTTRPSEPRRAAGLIPTGRLHPSPLNPRRRLDENELADLVKSLKEHGQLVPLIVRRSHARPGEYEIICGERRWHAAKRAGFDKLSARYLPQLDDNDELALELATVDNLERSSLNPYEETLAILTLAGQRLARIPGWRDHSPHPQGDPYQAARLLRAYIGRSPARRQEIARQHNTTTDELDTIIDGLFKHREGLRPNSFVANRLRLLELPHEIQESLQRGLIPYTIATTIARVEDDRARHDLLERAKAGASTRSIRETAKRHTLAASEQDPHDEHAARHKRILELARDIQTRLPHARHLNHNQQSAALAALKKLQRVLRE